MIRCFFSAIGLAAVMTIATVVFYEGVSLPLVGQVIDGAIANRLEGYVTLTEKTAADARAAEQKRQADAARAAAETFRKQMLEAKSAEAIATADLEKGILSYEQRLVETKRACLLDDSDLDSILRHR